MQPSPRPTDRIRILADRAAAYKTEGQRFESNDALINLKKFAKSVPPSMRWDTFLFTFRAWPVLRRPTSASAPPAYNNGESRTTIGAR
jgi:hypothetical protein